MSNAQIEVRREHAEVLARNLREFGYPDVTADTVIAEVAKPHSEQSVIGRMASEQLRDAGLLPEQEED